MEFVYASNTNDWLVEVIRVCPVEMLPVLMYVDKRSYMMVKNRIDEIRAQQIDSSNEVFMYGVQDRECCDGVQECEECKPFNDMWIEASRGLDKFFKESSFVYIYNHECLWLYQWIDNNDVDVEALIKKIEDYRASSHCVVIFHTICYLLYVMGYVS